MKKWLLRIVEGRYRCWDDFVEYGMVSAGHGNPPGAPLKALSVGDEVYAYLDARGYVGRGKVTRTAVLPGQFVVEGDFTAMDGTGRFNRLNLTDVLLRRSDMRDDADDPHRGEWVVGVQWLSTRPRKKPKHFAGMQVPSTTAEEITDPETENFLTSSFGI